MVELTDEMLHEMTDRIVETLKPRQIVLFGSHARNTARFSSDVDFLIIKDEPFPSGSSRRKEMARVWRLLASYPVSQDILIYSHDEIERWRYSRNHVIARALQEGKILYEREG